MGLRLKLGLAVGLLITAVFAVYGVFTIRAEREIYLHEMENRGVTLLRAFAIPAAVSMANNDTPALDNYVVQFGDAGTELDLRYLAALDYRGRVIAHTEPGEFGKVYEDPLTQEAMAASEPLTREVEEGGEPLLVVTMPVVAGLRWGTIRAGFTLVNVEAAIAASRNRVALFAIALAFSSSLAVYLVLSFLVMSPILRMRNMAARFGRGHLDSRVELWQSDEVGQLARAMNGMAQQIQDYTESLEKQVQERTAELAKANTQLLDVNVQLERLAKTDSLTGLFNRRHFMEQLDMEVRRGSRIQHHFAVIILDVDYFKSYNDTHGHTAGDELLQRLAVLLQINLRGTDVVARYGGEEFVILLLDTGPEEAHATAVKLQSAVAAQPFPLEETQPDGAITISVGVAFFPEDSRDGRKLVEYADLALYRSKEDGRNRVTRYDDIRNDLPPATEVSG